MSPVLAYACGLVTVPLLAAALLAVLTVAETGLEIECWVCGYSTGPGRDTRRITCGLRWRWHKLTTGHHTRRWLRAQKRLGVRLPEPTE